MADVRPFRALRYSASRVSMRDVITQPYDKITPDMRRRYYAASPCNLVRIILGDPALESPDVYSAAAAHFHSWREKGILLRDPEASIYIYAQRFQSPGSAAWFERHGFIALGKLHDYADHVVFRHELTLAKPKADRLNLLRATRAHFGQIFMLYSDPVGRIDELLAPSADPDIDVSDEYGVRHRVWRISGPAAAQVTALMADKKLIIADGHHRYETALAYSRENPGPGADFAMMTFVNMDAPGLLILPTHRVVSGLPGFDRDLFLRSVFAYFSVEKAPAPSDPAAVVAALRDGGARGAALVAVVGNDAFLIRPRSDAVAPVLATVHPRQRGLDVVLLHQVLLEKILELSAESIRDQQNVSYVRHAADAIQQVRDGAHVAFLMNPIPIEQVRDIAFAGEVLPQKSTDFYPKLLSGLTIYTLDAT